MNLEKLTSQIEVKLDQAKLLNSKSESTKHLSNEKNPGCLGYIGGFTIQLYRDYNKPLYIRIPINQPVQWKVRGFFSWLTWK